MIKNCTAVGFLWIRTTAQKRSLPHHISPWLKLILLLKTKKDPEKENVKTLMFCVLRAHVENENVRFHSQNFFKFKLEFFTLIIGLHLFLKFQLYF